MVGGVLFPSGTVWRGWTVPSQENFKSITPENVEFTILRTNMGLSLICRGTKH